MKVMHIISGGDTGGAKIGVITLLAKLKNIVEIHLVCFIEGEFSKEAREKGIHVTVLKQSGRWDLSVQRPLKEMIIKEGYDIINCHGARANFIGSLLKKDISLPIITTIHSDYRYDFDNNLYKKLVFTWLNKLSLRRLDAFIMNNPEFQESLKVGRIIKENLFIAYNGITLKTALEGLSKEEFLKKYNVKLSSLDKLVGIAARLHPVKGIDVFLKGALKIVETHKNVRFLIAGSGEEKEQEKHKRFILEHNLQDRVFLLGFVKEMSDFYRIIDINTLTSHSEGTSYALLKRTLYKKPSIASAVGGIPLIIYDKVNGLLFEDGDSQGFAEGVVRLLDNPDYAEGLGEALYLHVREYFSDDAMAKRYAEIYQELLERNRS